MIIYADLSATHIESIQINETETDYFYNIAFLLEEYEEGIQLEYIPRKQLKILYKLLKEMFQDD